MKSINIFLIALFSLSGLFVMAQEETMDRREKMQSLKIAHITNELNLTPEESTTFWPIYNKYEDARRQLKDEMRPTRKEMKSEMTEKEAKELVENHIAIKARELELEKQQVNDLVPVVGYNKLVKLHKAEQSFRLQLLRHHQKGQKQRKQMKGFKDEKEFKDEKGLK